LSERYEDVFLCPGSTEAALLAAGSVVEATSRVCAGEVQSAICVVRPPGHHAETDRAYAFCMFGNVAIAAAEARRQDWSKKTLIVDFDVHHGNGTQNMFADDPTVLYLSLHRYDGGKFFPGGKLGSYTSTGLGNGKGYSVNVPWDVESGLARGDQAPGNAETLFAFDQVLMPISREFAPDLVLISAGFDAAEIDPLGGCRLTPQGFYAITQKLMDLANGRLVLALEGGYNLNSSSDCMAACVRALLGDSKPPRQPTAAEQRRAMLQGPGGSSEELPAIFHVERVQATRRYLSKFWSSLRRTTV